MKKNLEKLSNYACGVNYGEKKVERSLKRKGAKNVQLSPGSRTAFDIRINDSKRWGVQVKTTCNENTNPKMPSKAELSRIIKTAEKENRTPVIALVHPTKNTQYIFARTGKKAIF